MMKFGIIFLFSVVSLTAAKTTVSPTQAHSSTTSSSSSSYSTYSTHGSTAEYGAAFAGTGAAAATGTGPSCEQGLPTVTTQATALIIGDHHNITGTLEFDQPGGTGPVTISGGIMGLPMGKHALHIQEYGSIRDGCAGGGEDYNPDNYPHGGPTDAERHAGDLGNVDVKSMSGVAVVHIRSSAFSLNGDYSVVGRSIAIYESMDDFGRKNTTESKLNGSSGSPIACGIIGIAAQEPNPYYTYKKDTSTNEI